MAGGAKESPRQRMIGMMYLVLTALLALQVSNAVLDKFVFIDETLQNSLRISRMHNDELVLGIEDAVKKAGNRPRDVAVLNNAKKIDEISDVLEERIYEIRTQIINDTGGKEDGNYVGAKDYDQVMNIMLGSADSKSGVAYDLHKEIDKFVADIKALDDSLATRFANTKITKEPSEMDTYKNNPDQKDKDWEKFNFDHTPTVAALAVLSHIQTEIAKVETEALEEMAGHVGADKIKFDRISVKVTPESKVVAAGTKYKARMFLAAGSSNITPRMSSSAGSVKVNAEGEGELEFTATPGAYDKDGRVDKTWKGSITIRGPLGDTTFSVTEEYTVVKPVLDIQSQSVQALYFKCGNELQVNVPALGSNYNPSFTASNAQVIKGSKKGQVTIVPTSSKSTLTVKSDGNLIGSRNFKVQLVPKPDIEIRSGKKAINLKQGGACPRSLNAAALADKGFKSLLPKDARFRVSQWTITLARGRRPIGNKTINGPSANISDLAGKARAGDRLVIEVKGVQRRNFRDQTENVNIGTQIFTYPIQ